MFCKYCGKSIDSDTIFCPECGRKQVSDTVSTTQRSAPKEDKIDYQNDQDRPPISVGFFDAIKNYYSNFANFNGRAVRSEWLWVVLYTGILSFVINIAFREYPIIVAAWMLIHMLPDISLRVRRLHDVGKSGWLYLLNLIPIVGTIILLVNLFKGSSFSDNQWGLSPYDTTNRYDETRTWRCEKCGCRTLNSYLACKNCGEIKPSPKLSAQPTPQEKSTKCVCGELFYGQICPNCGRTKKDDSR